MALQTLLPFIVVAVKVVTYSSLIVLFTKILKLWKNDSPYDNLPGPKPKSKLIGYLPDIHDPDNLEFHYKMVERHGHVARLRAGLIGSDGLYITDPLALHSILIKDQNAFYESTEFSGLFGVVHRGNGLASVTGSEHKKQRKLMNPVFTAANVAKLSPLFQRVSLQLRDRLLAEVKDGAATIDILDHLTRVSLELISQGGIGHTFNTFDKDNDRSHDFHEGLKNVLPSASKLFLILPFFESWRKIEPVWFRRGIAKLAQVLPWRSFQTFLSSVAAMQPVFSSVFYEKKKAFDQGGMAALANTASGGRDMTALLMQANADAEEEDRIDDQTIIANMSTIVLGGQETTSGAISRFLDLITLRPSLQTWLREEMEEALAAKNGQPLDYYELSALPRLDALCREALRLYAPVTFVWRQTMKDTVVPLQFPITDVKTGKEINELVIYKGTPVYIGIVASNRSTALWGPDASEFKPERWMDKLAHETTIDRIKTPGIFSNTMTFLGGGRGCPGMKFSLSEIKTVMSVLLPTFHFEKAKGSINWRVGITLSPYVKGEEEKGPRVPIKVSLL